MADLLAAYNNLPTIAKKQLIDLIPHFADNKKIRASSEYLTDKYKIKDKKIAVSMAIIDKVPTKVLLNPKFYDVVKAFDPRGNYVTLSKVISKGDRVRLVEGLLQVADGAKYPVIVKWYKAENRDTTYEINVYREMRRRGATIPWISSGFIVHTSRVLIMEPLLPLTAEDNEFEMAAEVLEQLRVLNRFAIHNDLKPGNIMKRNPKGKLPTDEITIQQAGKDAKYLVIDYGGVATKRLGYGYRRWCRSPRWSSEPMGVHDQITTARADFIELGYTMKTMQCWRSGEVQKGRIGDSCNYKVDPYRNGFKGKLAIYMKRAFAVDPKNILDKDYDDLIAILKAK